MAILGFNVRVYLLAYYAMTGKNLTAGANKRGKYVAGSVKGARGFLKPYI